MPFPLALETLVGKPLMFVIFALIGFAFGFALEISGFGNSKKLAAQFYFQEVTVLKVMFTAIIVAMVLIFTTVALGWLDYSAIWVNPTYLWSGIVGGLIMGVGFIIGGFCPGTSLVAAATLKIDGIFFVIGVSVGIFLFGETERFYDQWWNGSYYGRLTIMDWLDLPTGVVVLGVVLLALFMFWGGEQLERMVGGRDLKREPKFRYVGAAGLIAVAVAVLLIGQPDTERKWAWLEPTKAPLLAERKVQVAPAELLTNLADNRLRVVMLDVRPEAEYNLFHIKGAQHVPLAEIDDLIPEIHAQQAANTIFVAMSNDETAATEAWKRLTAESVPNSYLLEGGINGWLATFAAADETLIATPVAGTEDTLRYTFPAALGDRYFAAFPNLHESELEYTPKIELQIPRDKSGGGCG
jgi:rhodanese-related sulfurtransferase